MTASRRDQLVQTAVDLFYSNGYHATGIEKILTTAGVSKPTLYRHFDSKNELIVAALQKWDDDSRTWLEEEVDKRASTPRERLLAVFDAYHDWFREEGFQGCMFMNAIVEYPEQDNPIHLAALEHKRFVTAYMRDLLHDGGTADADELADQLMILLEGAIVTAHANGNSDAGPRARTMAEKILDGALA